MNKSCDLNAPWSSKVVKKIVLGTVLAAAWVSVGKAQSVPKNTGATTVPATSSSTNTSASQQDFVLFGRARQDTSPFFPPSSN